MEDNNDCLEMHDSDSSNRSNSNESHFSPQLSDYFKDIDSHSQGKVTASSVNERLNDHTAKHDGLSTI